MALFKAFSKSIKSWNSVLKNYIVNVMKNIKIKEIESLPGKRLADNAKFSFRCLPELSCFNLCCRNLNLFLCPYDVIRLKNRLGLSSGQFLDKYVDVVLRPSNFFPDALLTMSDNDEKTCPFLSRSGCRVYSDRPDTCRFFPVERGALYDAKTKKTEIIRFFRPPDFCMGRHEDKKWSASEWAKDQDAVFYDDMTALWATVKRLFQNNPWKNGGPDGPDGRMAFMAAYNVDAFREFVFNSSFLKRFKVRGVILKKIERNDTELLKFGFEWIKLFLWGIETKSIVPKK